MPYMHVGDDLHDRRETRSAGLEAMGLWAVAGSWCADPPLTDGFVPEAVAIRWAPRRLRVLAAALVTAGMWQRSTVDGEDGWQFVGWAEDGQPTVAGMEAARLRKVEAGRRGGRASGAARRTKTQAAASPPADPLLPPDEAGAQAETKPNPQPQPEHPQPPPADPSVGVRANALATGYAELVPMCNHPAIAAVCRKAIKAGFVDEQISGGLATIAAQGRSVTTDSLRLAMTGAVGVPAVRASTTDGRVGAGLALVAELRAEEGSG